MTVWKQALFATALTVPTGVAFVLAGHFGGMETLKDLGALLILTTPILIALITLFPTAKEE